MYMVAKLKRSRLVDYGLEFVHYLLLKQTKRIEIQISDWEPLEEFLCQIFLGMAGGTALTPESFFHCFHSYVFLLGGLSFPPRAL